MGGTKEIEAQGHMPVFEKRPYGARFKLDDSEEISRTLVMLNPHASTSAGIPEDKLRKGLRGHLGEKCELVTLVGYADGKPGTNEILLRYKFENNYHEIDELLFRPSSKFYSVSNGGEKGFWHVLENFSDRPIMLLVEVEKKPMDIRHE